MHPLTKYYIHQAGGGGGIGPIYSLPPFIQSGHGIGDYLGPLFRFLNLCSSEVQRPAPRHWGVQPCRRGVTFSPTSRTTLRGIKRLFPNTFRRPYPLRWQVAVVANADVLHHAPDNPRLKDANARFPHVVKGNHLRESESVAAVLNAAPL